jgi:signal transduction histidine kinase
MAALPMDLMTLSIVAGVISLFQAVAFLVVRVFNRKMAGATFWGVSALLNGLGMVFLTLRFALDAPLLTKAVPTLMNFVSAVFFYNGACAFMGRKVRFKWPLLCCSPLFAGYLWFLLADDRVSLRVLFASSIFITFLWLGACEFFAEQRAGLRFSSRWIGVSALALCAVFVYRSVALALRGGTGDLFDPAAPQIALFVATIAWSLSWTFGTLLLINQRHLMEITASHEAHLRDRDEIAAIEAELQAERAMHQRKHLLRDLHDGMGGLTANLAQLAALGEEEDREGVDRLLKSIEQLAIEGNRELRLLMNSLESGVTYWGDFLREFRSHAEPLAESKCIALHWKTTGRPAVETIADLPAALSLMRAFKEAMSNLARHSEASRASVRVTFRWRCIGVMVSDNGRGFPENASSRGGRGLANMRRRMEELGGRLRIRNSGGGRLSFVVPLPLTVETVPRKYPASMLAPPPLAGLKSPS